MEQKDHYILLFFTQGPKIHVQMVNEREPSQVRFFFAEFEWNTPTEHASHNIDTFVHVR